MKYADQGNMSDLLMNALPPYLLALGDDELVLGHRDSEWCGHAPILEEDIAFANLALDEIGHANLWYSLLAELSGKDPNTYSDELIYRRDLAGFRCARLVELPNGDWAYSMLRQYLFDAAESVRLTELVHSKFAPLAETAVKIQKEEVYHLRHTEAWTRRLGLGTEESHRRMQIALDMLWPYTGQLFEPFPKEDELAKAGILPTGDQLHAAWLRQVSLILQECGLETILTNSTTSLDREQHTPYLKVLVDEMQSVAHMQPDATW